MSTSIKTFEDIEKICNWYKSYNYKVHDFHLLYFELGINICYIHDGLQNLKWKEILIMNLYFKPFYKKDSYTIDTNIPFNDDCDFEASVHKYYINAGFDLYAVNDEYANTGKVVATVNAIFFNIKEINKDNINIVDIADVMDTSFTDDIVEAIELFINNDFLLKKEKVNCFCYLNRVYVYPEFRNHGIASYLFENIQQIFKYITDNEIQIIFIFPKPQEPSNNGWRNSEDTDNIMINKMVSKIQQFNFVPVEETGFYCKIF